MSIIALLLIVFASLFIAWIGATALMMTGLSRSVAKFQAISCFFGVGFTTAEAEMIVSHPVRRKIASHLIILGNLGITGALGALIVTMVKSDPDWVNHLFGIKSESKAVHLLMAAGIFGVTVLVFRLGFVHRLIEATIRFSLERSGVVRAMDYETLLRAREGYVVSEFEIDPGHPFIGRTLESLALGKNGVLVLGILRESGEYEPTPSRLTTIEEGDVLTVYGEETRLRETLSAKEVSQE